MSTFYQNPQIKRTKRLLQDALIELLKEKPYQKITVTDIVTRSGLSRTTFYAHYEYKEELIEQCLEDLMAKIFNVSFLDVKSLSSSRNGNSFPPSPEQERISMSNLVRQWQNNHSFFRALEEAGLKKIILSTYMEKHRMIFQEKVKERLPFSPSKAMIDYYLVFICNAQIGILQHWLATNMELPVDALVDFLTVVTSPGLFLKIFDKNTGF